MNGLDALGHGARFTGPRARWVWGLRKAQWGKGYALEAVAASLDYAFDQLDWDSVTHLMADENAMQEKLAARLGSKPGE